MKVQLILGIISTMFVSTFVSATLAAPRSGKPGLSREAYDRKTLERIKEVKDGARKVKTDKLVQADRISEILLKKVERMSNGTMKDSSASPSELKTAVRSEHELLNIDGKTTTKISGAELAVSMLGLRKTIETVNDQIKRGDFTVDPTTSEKIRAQQEIMPYLVEQLAILGKKSIGAGSGSTKSDHDILLDTALAVKLLNEGINTAVSGTAAEINSYKEVAQSMAKIKSAEPLLTADVVLDKALLEKYGSREKTNEAKKRLKDCMGL